MDFHYRIIPYIRKAEVTFKELQLVSGVIKWVTVNLVCSIRDAQETKKLIQTINHR